MIEFTQAAAMLRTQERVLVGQFEEDGLYCALGALGVAHMGEMYERENDYGEVVYQEGAEYFEKFLLGSHAAEGSWPVQIPAWEREMGGDSVRWMENCAVAVVDKYGTLEYRTQRGGMGIDLGVAWEQGRLTPADVIAFYNDYCADTPDQVADLLAHEGEWFM
jgi:hypothetical protein